MTWKQSQILQYAVNFCQTTLVLAQRYGKATKFYYRFPYFFSNNSVFFSPHAIIASMMGISVIPNGVIAYSERGGSSG